jgi:hypothetical protein
MSVHCSKMSAWSPQQQAVGIVSSSGRDCSQEWIAHNVRCEVQLRRRDDLFSDGPSAPLELNTGNNGDFLVLELDIMIHRPTQSPRNH